MWLRNYINGVAPWLDMFDVQQASGRKVPLLTQTSPSLTYAILAISARQMEREEKLQGDHDSLQLYQEAVKSLTPQLQTTISECDGYLCHTLLLGDDVCGAEELEEAFGWMCGSF
jgi:hypothetical protein